MFTNVENISSYIKNSYHDSKVIKKYNLNSNLDAISSVKIISNFHGNGEIEYRLEEFKCYLGDFLREFCSEISENVAAMIGGDMK